MGAFFLPCIFLWLRLLAFLGNWANTFQTYRAFENKNAIFHSASNKYIRRAKFILIVNTQAQIQGGEQLFKFSVSFCSPCPPKTMAKIEKHSNRIH